MTNRPNYIYILGLSCVSIILIFMFWLFCFSAIRAENLLTLVMNIAGIIGCFTTLIYLTWLVNRNLRLYRVFGYFYWLFITLLLVVTGASL